MATYRKQLKDKDGNNIIPVTNSAQIIVAGYNDFRKSLGSSVTVISTKTISGFVPNKIYIVLANFGSLYTDGPSGEFGFVDVSDGVFHCDTSKNPITYVGYFQAESSSVQSRFVGALESEGEVTGIEIKLVFIPID